MLMRTQHNCKTTFVGGMNPWALPPEPPPPPPPPPKPPKPPKPPRVRVRASRKLTKRKVTDEEVIAAIKAGKTTPRAIYTYLDSDPKQTTYVLSSLLARKGIKNIGTTHRRVFVVTKASVAKLSARAKVLRFLKQHPGSTSPDIAKSICHVRADILLLAMTREGLVTREKVRHGYGYWVGNAEVRG